MKDEEIKHSTLMIELDCLLDTRISVLSIMGKDAVDKALNFKYHDRMMDIFPGVDHKKFKELYDNRDKTILKETFITPMGSFIKEFCSNTLLNVITSPFHAKPKIVLNVYPYELLDEEIDVLLRSLVSLTNESADIEVLSMAPEEITPAYVKNNLSILIMYEYDLWIEMHCVSEAFKKTICPEVSMFAPAIFFKMPEKTHVGKLDPLKVIETLAAPLISLKLLPIEMFSFVLPTKT